MRLSTWQNHKHYIIDQSPSCVLWHRLKPLNQYIKRYVKSFWIISIDFDQLTNEFDNIFVYVNNYIILLFIIYIL